LEDAEQVKQSHPTPTFHLTFF
jgi:stress-induced-phosphoprotein 1